MLYLNWIVYFNSIKVRLKQTTLFSESVDDKFQFHKGTIKTKFAFLHLKFLVNFNSIKVRLKRLQLEEGRAKYSISIP